MIPTHAELHAALLQPAFIDPLEVPVLCHYAAQSHVRRIVEIGCAWGGSSVLFLMNMPNGAHLSSIDAFVPDSYGGWQATQAQCIQAVYTALHTFGYLHRFQDWSLIPHTSQYVAERWQAPTPIDVLFVDGSHLEEDVRQDWEMWTPFVRKGGTVMLHDSRKPFGAPDYPFPMGYDGPTALANELRIHPNWQLVGEAFSLTVWRKLI